MPTKTRETPQRAASTFADLMARELPEQTERFNSTDRALLAEYQEAQSARTIAQINGSARDRTDADKQVEELRQRLDDSPATIRVRIRGLEGGDFNQLMRAHPPTKEALAEYEATQDKYEQSRPQYNPDTFNPALLAAALIEPELTLEQAGQLIKRWPEGDTTRLLQVAIQLSHGTTAVDLGN